jgi:signal transduction histidine kinase
VIARAPAAGIARVPVDALLALAIAVELEIEVWFSGGISAWHRPLAAAAAVLYAAPIVIRRRWPATALMACGAVIVWQALVGAHLDAANGVLLPPVVLAYSAGAGLDLRRGLRALAVAAGLFGAFLVVSGAERASVDGVATGASFLALFMIVPWLVGRVARERGRRAEGFALLAAQTAAEHAEHERAVVTKERARIGGELQDIIAHSVTAMVIQAGGARQLLRSDPDRARESILAVEHAGREALADLRRLVGMLRKDDDPRALAPQPGLDELAALMRSTQESGLTCELRIEGEQVDLTPGVDLVAYRIVEAALALASAHGSRSARVAVHHGPQSLRLTIGADGPAPDIDRELPGLHERVGLYGGELRADIADEGRYLIQARLPLGTGVLA